MDPLAIRSVVQALESALVDDGVDAAAISEPIAGYVERLTELDVEIENTLAPVPPERRVLVTNHDSLGYFADRYDLEVVGAVIPSLTTSADASPAELDDLADAMRERSVNAIFAETTESDRLANALADQVGEDVAVVELFSGSLGPAGSGADTYVTMMETNSRLIADALS